MAKAIRRQYVVKKDLQLSILAETALLMFLVAVLVGLSVYLGIFRTLLFELSGEKLTLVNRMISLRMVMWFLPTVFAIIILSIFLSHRIAGPIFVFQRVIRGIAKGEAVRKIHLRKNDRLKDLAEDLNTLIDHLGAERAAQPKRK